jgi:hypothetical protein
MKKNPACPPRDAEDHGPSPARISFDTLSSRAQQRAQAAYDQIAMDEGLTGALTDAAARPLLDRAQEEIVRLAAAADALDDAAGEAGLSGEVAALRKRLREIARQSAAAPAPKAAVLARLQALRHDAEPDSPSQGTAIVSTADEDGETAS